MENRESAWINYHLYYHQDLGAAILGLVQPLVGKLLRYGWIDSFFFIRYRLGGPHIRLRLHARPGVSGRVTETAEAEAGLFLANHPSVSALTEEEIRRQDGEIMASNPQEFDLSVYPDNSFRAFPFRPEIERYGGPALWGDSLDFFALSSATVFAILAGNASEPRSRQLAVAFRALACQALGFARDEEDLVSLLRYGVESWGREMPRALAKAERILVEQRDTFDRLFRRELDLLAAGPNAVGSAGEEAKAQLGEAACRLSWAIREADRCVHQRIGTSHLHMTANRLGLSNAEEVYLSQILTTVATGLLAAGFCPARLWGLDGAPDERSAPRYEISCPGRWRGSVAACHLLFSTRLE